MAGRKHRHRVLPNKGGKCVCGRPSAHRKKDYEPKKKPKKQPTPKKTGMKIPASHRNTLIDKKKPLVSKKQQAIDAMAQKAEVPLPSSAKSRALEKMQAFSAKIQMPAIPKRVKVRKAKG